MILNQPCVFMNKTLQQKESNEYHLDTLKELPDTENNSIQFQQSKGQLLMNRNFIMTTG